MLKGIPAGIFTTKSEFQNGATNVCEVSAASGYPIELWDATRFLDALGVVRRSAPFKLVGDNGLFLCSYANKLQCELGLRIIASGEPDLWVFSGHKWNQLWEWSEPADAQAIAPQNARRTKGDRRTKRIRRRRYEV